MPTDHYAGLKVEQKDGTEDALYCSLTKHPRKSEYKRFYLGGELPVYFLKISLFIQLAFYRELSQTNENS